MSEWFSQYGYLVAVFFVVLVVFVVVLIKTWLLSTLQWLN